MDSDLTHDYAEIYTPSREKLDWDSNGKPPTPPLHRFPSWESRIYQVANEGLSNSLPSHSDQSFRIPPSVPYAASSGYCDISCPVYATVKGVRIYDISLSCGLFEIISRKLSLFCLSLK